MGEEKGEMKWERWQKERIFVREVKGIYDDVYKKMLGAQRVYKSKEIPFKGGPVAFGKHIIHPKVSDVTQVIETHIETIAPGGRSQKHGHLNGAVMYVLEGRGYEIHEGERFEWEAGDAFLVKNACVHQHFNSDPEKPARLLVMKGKPLYLFFNLLYQKTVQLPPDEAMPGWEDWHPEE